MEDNRKKALSAALTQIERQFGKGAIMKMGDTPVRQSRPFLPVLLVWTLLLALVACLMAGFVKSTALKALVKLRWLCRLLPKPRSRAKRVLLLMLSTPLILSMLKSWA